jgi:beta-glucosidase
MMIPLPLRIAGLAGLLAFAGLAARAADSIGSTANGSATPIYLDPSQALDARLEDLLSRLTLEEKIALIHGNSKFTVAGVPRLQVPLRWLSDGPHGVREDVGPDTWKPAGHTNDFSSAMPAGICLASTWDPAIAHDEGAAIGEEARARGKDIMLGPGVNIMRTPLCGRNFEYMGEDPVLTGKMAIGYIQGEQSEDVSSCVKHFALNNQETDRNKVDVEVDERTLREIYLPAFEAAVKQGGVLSVMGAYNKFRGTYCCENPYLLNDILKKEWGFTGMVVSDWSAAHTTAGCALGLDLEMGTNGPYDQFFLAQPYLDQLKAGALPMAELDDKVRRNLRVMFAIHMFDPDRKTGAINTEAHQTVARHVAEEGVVLLKNEGNALPLDAGKIRTIAVIGENATRLQSHGGESSEIKAFYEVTPLAGLVKRAGSSVNIVYSQGYGLKPDPQMTKRAIAAAKSADVVIFVGGLNHDRGNDCEGDDRKNLKLPYGQEDLIKQIAAANPHTVVILEGTIVEMGGWIDKVPAVLQAWYPGMEGGDALAGILFGDVNPSGKLPCTIPKVLADAPAQSPNEYPGVSGTETYSEGLLVGYRWYDAKKIAPQFPFGYGLSYTSFSYSNLRIVESGSNADPGAEITVQFDVTNIGARKGTDVAQLYLHEEHALVMRPEKELKGFQRVTLLPGATAIVTMPLRKRDFAWYSPEIKGWQVDPAMFEIMAGNSSRNLPLRQSYQVRQLSQISYNADH